MGKRKREGDDRESCDYLLYKIKKLEKELKGGRRRHRHEPADSDSLSARQSPANIEDGIHVEDDYSVTEEELIDCDTIRSIVHVPEQSASATAPHPSPPPPAVSGPPTATPTQLIQSSAAEQEVKPLSSEQSPTEMEGNPPLETVEQGVSGLDSTILELLGDDPTITKQYGKDIQSDLAVRLQHIATTGLSKETRKELCDKYLPPNNCHLIDAPELNPEIKAAVSDSVIKRDKGIELKQKQLGRAISCIGEALSSLLAKEDKDTSIIKLLMDASRLLCDNQNLDSVTRRNFVLYNLKKEMKDQMQKTKIDKFLFGTDLAETLKTAKSISKSGSDLKPPASSNKVATPKNKPAQQHTGVHTKRNNLNWKAPPLNRRPQGTQRTREPAQRNQHASSSRPSYRASHQRSNRR